MLGRVSLVGVCLFPLLLNCAEALTTESRADAVHKVLFIGVGILAGGLALVVAVAVVACVFERRASKRVRSEPAPGGKGAGSKEEAAGYDLEKQQKEAPPIPTGSPEGLEPPPASVQALPPGYEYGYDPYAYQQDQSGQPWPDQKQQLQPQQFDQSQQPADWVPPQQQGRPSNGKQAWG